MAHDATWMKLENLMLSERSHILYDFVQRNSRTGKSIKTESRPVGTKGERTGGEGLLMGVGLFLWGWKCSGIGGW